MPRAHVGACADTLLVSCPCLTAALLGRPYAGCAAHLLDDLAVRVQNAAVLLLLVALLAREPPPHHVQMVRGAHGYDARDGAGK